MTITTNLGLTLVDQAQAQKEVTINQAFIALDACAGNRVLDRDLSAPPGSPVAGTMYIVGASPTGAWAGKAQQLTYYDQIWRFVVPQAGWHVWVADEYAFYRYNGTSWQVAAFGRWALDATNTAGGTTGAQTINKPAGTVNFAAGASSLVVTNALCTSSSLVFASIRTNDSTAVIKNVVPGAGSFTIRLNAAATAETSVGFMVVN